LTLAYQAGFFTTGWLSLKLALVLAMSGLHGFFGGLRRKFAKQQNEHSPRFFRILNEIPTLLMVGIVVLVVLKPFQN
jgi:putative membrane protein